MTLIDARPLNLATVQIPYGTEAVLMTVWGSLEVHMGAFGYWETLDGSLIPPWHRALWIVRP